MLTMKHVYIARAFAVANLVFVSVGVWIFACLSRGLRRGSLPPASLAPFALHFYVVDAIFTTLILTALVYSAVRLLRGGVLAARTARLVYIWELIYIFASLCVAPVVQVSLPLPWRESMIAGHRGLVALWPQVLTAYPLIGAIVMTLLIRRESRQSASRI